MSDTEPGSRERRPDGFEALFDDAPCGYLSLSADGRIANANRRIAAWTGYSKDDLLGRRLHDLLSAPARIFYETNISPLLRMQGFVDEVAVDLVASNRSRISCLMNASEARDGEGKLRYTRLAIFKATERRRYERALVEGKDATERAAAAEREISQLREQFIAVLGHDLRNPLASISSGIRLLTDRENISSKGERILALMQGSVVRASDLIENVLDFARGRLGGGLSLLRSADAPLTPLLEQVVAEIGSVSPGRDIRCTFTMSDPVDCDRTRIGQLLSNLLGNAVTHGSKTQPIEVRGDTDGARFTLSVANGGIPISPSAMEKLFEPFFRGERRPTQMGLGLGLHIASEIAKAHDGELTVVSNDVETRFTFTMPLAPPVPDDGYRAEAARPD